MYPYEVRAWVMANWMTVAYCPDELGALECAQLFYVRHHYISHVMVWDVRNECVLVMYGEETPELKDSQEPLPDWRLDGF